MPMRSANSAFDRPNASRNAISLGVTILGSVGSSLADSSILPFCRILPFFQSKMFPRLTYGRFFHYTIPMIKQTPITDLIDEWKPRRALAEAIGANIASVHKWAKANRIPSEWQAQVVRAAQDKGLERVSADWMIEAHDRQNSPHSSSGGAA